MTNTQLLEMFAISPTDKNWFDFLKIMGFNSGVNFWTPTPWNVKGIKNRDRLYFMLKSPIRKIGGFGEFAEYKNLTAVQAWNEFGYRNGRSSREEFIDSIQEYINKNSSKFGGGPINISKYEIGCLRLNNCEFWEEEQFVDLNTLELNFAPQVVTIKYFDQYDPIRLIQQELDNFDLVNEPRFNKKLSANSREGQSLFKGRILKAYDNKCCITGENIPELLEAAHIQEYKNRYSNHVQNGLLLRVDIHRLYDNQLIFIDENYIIHVSALVTSKQYRQYHGKPISLPKLVNQLPSKTALELRRNEFRN